MKAFNKEDQVFFEQQAFDEFYNDDNAGTSAEVIANIIAEDFSFRNINEEQFKAIIEMVEVEQVADRDYQAIYEEAFEAVSEQDEYWYKVIYDMIGEEDKYESAFEVHDRIFDVSDWRENGFNTVQVQGIYDAIIGMTEAAWDVVQEEK